MHSYEQNYFNYSFNKSHRDRKKKTAEEQQFTHFVRIQSLTTSLIHLVKCGPQTA